jgi:hypothetical protein
MVIGLRLLSAQGTSAQDTIAVRNLVQPGYLKRLEATRGSPTALSPENSLLWDRGGGGDIEPHDIDLDPEA